jgi:redox-sensitive bicupin YhaK (pirin superfamily)
MDEAKVAAETCTSLSGETFESFANSHVKLGALPISRALPVRGRRLVGPWCFLDRFGPMSFSDGKPMDVAPHPHIGLQTVTWLLDGEVLHDDSLGCEAVARPGGVNVMTSGNGIAHAEQTPVQNTGSLNGVQLWVALPDANRRMNASFQAVDRVPCVEQRSGLIHVFAGSFEGVASPARHFTDILGADLQVHPGETLEVELSPQYEHAVLVLSGDCRLADQQLSESRLYYLGLGRSIAAFSTSRGAKILLIGGPPFPETVLMWWNFVARTPEEIAEAKTDWEQHRRFGDVRAYAGPRLRAPDLMRLARPNPMS